jgi:hypothetical protein
MKTLTVIGLSLIACFIFVLFLILIDLFINEFELLPIRRSMIQGEYCKKNGRLFYVVYEKRFLLWSYVSIFFRLLRSWKRLLVL